MIKFRCGRAPSVKQRFLRKLSEHAPVINLGYEAGVSDGRDWAPCSMRRHPYLISRSTNHVSASLDSRRNVATELYCGMRPLVHSSPLHTSVSLLSRAVAPRGKPACATLMPHM